MTQIKWAPILIGLFGHLLVINSAIAGLQGERRAIFLKSVVPSCVQREQGGSSGFTQKQIYQWCNCKFSAMADVVTEQDIVNFSNGYPMPKLVLDTVDRASTACLAKVLYPKSK